MKYFKIIEDNVIVGAITSNNFMRYLPITDCFVRANEQTGEYATYNSIFYRSTWMQPIVCEVKYREALIIEINEEEYNAFIVALQSNEIIVNEEVEETPVEEIPEVKDLINELSLDFIRTSKLSEMSHACRKTIENGFDLELRNEIKHFSLDTQDQLNLITLNAMADTEDAIPYHADGEECIFYTAAEIKKIVAAANNFKIYQTTYYNALKAYINSLETIEDIAAVEYGMTIPEEYQTEVLKSL